MLDELRTLARSLGSRLARSTMRRAVIEDNVLGKDTVNAREYSFKKLSTRYFPEHKPNATRVFVEHFVREEDVAQEGLLAYLMLLWTDGLMFELGRRWLERRLGLPGYEPTQDEILEQLEYLRHDNQRLSTWTNQTRGKIASNYLNTLRDCGLASGRARKTLVRPFVSPSTVGFGAHLLAGSGMAPHQVPEAELFRLVGLEPVDVIEGLSALDQQGELSFRVQGGVVLLDFGGAA